MRNNKKSYPVSVQKVSTHGDATAEHKSTMYYACIK